MSIFEAIILGLVQGLTEFIPVSSSGHLVIADEVLGATSSVAFDVALHIGTLVALLVYFRRDIAALARDLFGGAQQKLAIMLAVVTAPAALVGFLFADEIEQNLRTPTTVAVALVAGAALMVLVEYVYPRMQRRTKQLAGTSWRQALTVGVSQAAALVPGVSRSGITMTAGMFAGFTREAAARFSFLLAIPIIAGAGLATLLDADSLSTITDAPGVFFAGFVAAGVSGLIAIHFLISFLRHRSLHVFAVYRTVLAVAIILFVA